MSTEDSTPTIIAADEEWPQTGTSSQVSEGGTGGRPRPQGTLARAKPSGHCPWRPVFSAQPHRLVFSRPEKRVPTSRREDVRRALGVPTRDSFSWRADGRHRRLLPDVDPPGHAAPSQSECQGQPCTVTRGRVDAVPGGVASDSAGSAH